MTPAPVEHLIVGSSCLALALADHLLRRGAERVVLLETGTVGPAARAATDPGLILRTGLAEYTPWEQRSLLLLEEWATYLESNPRYERCGSVTLGPAAQLAAAFDGEPLSASQVSSRFPHCSITSRNAVSMRSSKGLFRRRRCSPRGM